MAQGPRERASVFARQLHCFLHHANISQLHRGLQQGCDPVLYPYAISVCQKHNSGATNITHAATGSHAQQWQLAMASLGHISRPYHPQITRFVSSSHSHTQLQPAELCSGVWHTVIDQKRSVQHQCSQFRPASYSRVLPPAGRGVDTATVGRLLHMPIDGVWSQLHDHYCGQTKACKWLVLMD